MPRGAGVFHLGYSMEPRMMYPECNVDVLCDVAKSKIGSRSYDTPTITQGELDHMYAINPLWAQLEMNHCKY